jgi:hypothetical protein
MEKCEPTVTNPPYKIGPPTGHLEHYFDTKMGYLKIKTNLVFSKRASLPIPLYTPYQFVTEFKILQSDSFGIHFLCIFNCLLIHTVQHVDTFRCG